MSDINTIFALITIVTVGYYVGDCFYEFFRIERPIGGPNCLDAGGHTWTLRTKDGKIKCEVCNEEL